MKDTRHRSYGFIPTPVVLGIFVTSAALIAGFVLQQPYSSQAQSTNAFILPPAVANRDIQSTVSDPTGSSTWDGIIKGSLCFDVNPPSFGGKYRAVLVMDLKDEPDAVIGASVTRLLSSPSTVKCGSRSRRDSVFNIAFNLPDKDLWKEACPEIKILIETEGNWKQRPQEEIARLSREFLCPRGVPSNTPTPSPTTPPSTITPPQVPLTPAAQASPSPVPAAVSGTISVYSCQKPKLLTVDICDNENKTGCQTVRLQSSEANDSVWLKKNEGEDRTYIYGYKVTKNSQGNPLVANSKMSVSDAFASIPTIKGTDSSFISAKDPTTVITIPATHDKTIDAQYLTCGCPFHARTYIKDAKTGNILDVSSASVGTANDMQIIKSGDKLTQTFNKGVIDVRTDFFDFAKRFISNPLIPFSDYGVDGLATVRLYAPYTVVKQECTSKGEIAACPGHTQNFTKETSSKDFQNLRVTCGVDVEYGWVVENVGAQGFAEQSPFTIEQADVDGNGVVNILDLTTCEESYGETDGQCDLDLNGLINSTDFAGVVQYVGESVE